VELPQLSPQAESPPAVDEPKVESEEKPEELEDENDKLSDR